MKRFPKQKWLLVLVIILLLTNIITLSIYWWKDKPHARPNNNNREKKMGQFMVNEMKFDKDQETIYWKMRDTLVSQQRTVMDSIRAAKRRFFDLLKQKEVIGYDSLLDARSNEIISYQKKLELLTFRHFEEVKRLCTPEQLQKFDTVIQEIVNRMTSFRRPSNNKGDSTKVRDSVKK